MAIYERETRIDAPLDAVWEFHSTVEGLRALTPEWARLRVEAVIGPDGDPLPTSAPLETGTTVHLSVRPFGIGSRREWISEIVDRDRRTGAAYFRDEMRDGPFRRWIHTHAFFADDGATRLRDRVEYRSPAGPGADPFGRPILDAGFRYRHRRTRELLGDDRRADGR